MKTSPSNPASQLSAGIAHYLQTSQGSGQFTGGDGTYSIPLANGRSAWIFGDSFVGGVRSDGSRSSNPETFVRNSIVLQDSPTNLRLITGRDKDGIRVDAALPPNMRENRDGSGPDEWYWPGHGTTRDDGHLLVFMNRFTQPVGSLEWSWKYRGTDLATFDAQTGALLATKRMFQEGKVLWGSAVLEQGNYTYVYGTEDPVFIPGDAPQAHVARVQRKELEDRAAWEFWDGHEWTSDALKSARLGAQVSNQFSAITAADGSTTIITQQGLDPSIRAWNAPSPQGPFTNSTVAATIPDLPNGRHSYNSVAHPQLTTEDGLLLSYNVGGADFMLDHTSYRPGFLRIPHDRLPGGNVQVKTSAGVESLDDDLA